MSYFALKRFDGVDVVVNSSHIVTMIHNKGWGGDSYVIHLLDGREMSLDVKCGNKMWESFHVRASHMYLDE